jgi:hypothetical protein
LTDEQLVISQIQPTPEQTADAWEVLPVSALTLNWAEVALLATQHRVEGILESTLRLVGCADQVSTSVLSGLRRRADLADARYQACYQALMTLWEDAPEIVAELVFFKGASLASLYEAPHHRMLGDFDFIVPAEQLDNLRRVFEHRGYWEKPGRNGPTFFGNCPSPQAGAEFVCFDLHVAAPPKYHRTESSLDRVWLNDTEPFSLGEVKCRRLSAELELLELLVHAAEHASSWIHVCLDDDVRLIRLLDVELLCARRAVDADRVVQLSSQLDLDGELALGAAQLAALRGQLPQALASLQSHVEAGRDFLDHVALPDGRIEQFSTPLAKRAFVSNRNALALMMMPADKQHRQVWFDWRKGLIDGKEEVASIAAMARHRFARGADHG